ncbi:hypothetical protein IE53DRAFT_412121 [Violaceomyces palustris]|uniref:Uncharacterized protein n=1 Tax=Violaceomyces palustris TaxID=1673888 RepID=A0ACD0NSI7_9BASI|nr:hypothetical protein IE53DRAFT_412121 [Violaceomyces palustris]
MTLLEQDDASPKETEEQVREVLRNIKAKLEGASRSDHILKDSSQLLSLLLSPLQILGLLPLREPPERHSRPLGLTSNPSLILSHLDLIQTVQTSLLGWISIDWSRELSSSSFDPTCDWDHLVDLWFFGPTATSQSHQSVRGVFQLVSLKTLSQVLSNYTTTHLLGLQALDDGLRKRAGSRVLVPNPARDQGADDPSSFPSPKRRQRLHPMVESTLIDNVLARFPNNLDLIEIHDALKQENNRAKREMAWSESIRLAVSLPDRISNFLEGRATIRGLGQAEFLANLTFQLERLVGVISRRQGTGKLEAEKEEGREGREERVDVCDQREDVRDAKVFLSRLIRVGYVSSFRDSTSKEVRISKIGGEDEKQESGDFWSNLSLAISSSISNQTGPDGPSSDVNRYRRTWRLVVSDLPNEERLDSLVYSLLRFLEKRSGEMGVSKLVAAEQERGKAGLEGKTFFGGLANDFVRSCLVLLDIFCFWNEEEHGPSRAKSRGEDWKSMRTSGAESVFDFKDASSSPSSDEEGDGGEGERGRARYETFRRFFLPETWKTHGLHRSLWSPIMARTMVIWLGTAKGEATLERVVDITLLHDVVDVWSNKERLKRTTVDQELYLTTLFLSLHCAASKRDPETWSKVSSSSTFLNGVSNHLENLDSEIRRYGMLVAEVVSHQKAALLGGGGRVQDQGGVKVLRFPKSLWQGSGEGKEESRVLRALVESWEFVTPLLVKEGSAADAGGLAKGLGIILVEIQGQVEGGVGTDEVVEGGGTRDRTKKERSRPKSRTLPVRIPPPPRRTERKAKSRPLIQVIGEDEDEVGDTSLGSEAGKRRAKDEIITFSDSEEEGKSSSSSSEGDQDDSSIEGTDSEEEDRGMSGLASTLSGLEGLAGEEMEKGMKEALLRSAGWERKGKDSSAGKREKMKETVPGKGSEEVEDDESSHLPDFASKKRPKPPIYVHEISELLRSGERLGVKIGLKHAEELIRRKMGWGGEVDENAVDLAFALCGLHNNFSLRLFEERRTAALTALIVASPRIATSCVIEQIYSSHYSLAQRHSMLNSIALSARELSNLDPSPRRSSSKRLESSESTLEQDADEAMRKVKQRGEDKVVEIVREKSLLVHQRRGDSSSILPFVREEDLIRARIRKGQAFNEIGPSQFVFPLLNRLRASIQESERSSHLGRNPSFERPGRTGRGQDLGLVKPILETLYILLLCSKTSTSLTSMLESTCELILELVRPDLDNRLLLKPCLSILLLSLNLFTPDPVTLARIQHLSLTLFTNLDDPNLSDLKARSAALLLRIQEITTSSSFPR